MSGWWRSLLDIIYPPRCPVCRRSATEHGQWCPVCLAAVQGGCELSLSMRRLRWLDGCLALGGYTAGAKTLLHRLKFCRERRQAVYLRQLLSRAAAGRLGRPDAVAPVPLHPDRLAERGFNQTELIFRSWAEQAGWLWIEPLTRVRPTRPQWELTRAERRENIKGAFNVTRPELVRGKSILLVDDIVTTGVTMDECAKELKSAGAVRVTGLALAGGGDS